MNASDRRVVDYDRYRQRALDMRQQAINEVIDRLVAWLKSLRLSRPRSAVSGRTVPAPPCTA